MSEANCPEAEPTPEASCYQKVMALREAHDRAAAELCAALDDLQQQIQGDALSLTGSQLAYQEGRRDGRSEMARELIQAIDYRLAAYRPLTMGHQALSILRQVALQKAIP